MQVAQDVTPLVKVFAMLGVIVDAKDVQDVLLFAVAIVVGFVLQLRQELALVHLLQVVLMPMVAGLVVLIRQVTPVGVVEPAVLLAVKVVVLGNVSMFAQVVTDVLPDVQAVVKEL